MTTSTGRSVPVADVARPAPGPAGPIPADERQSRELSGPPVKLQFGGQLAGVTVAYETYGRLDASGGNAILVCHALTGDSHVAGAVPGQSLPGWWEGLVGPGAPLDTDRYFVICSNVLGGCRGTTGPRSIDPASGQRWDMRFPTVTIGDMVRVQRRLLDELEVRQLALVVGGSMGGMQALDWTVRYPAFVRRAAVIAAPARTAALAIALNEIQRQAILRDPAWQDGRYDDGHGPQAGLGLARMVGMVSYGSEAALDRKFGRRAVSAHTGHPPAARRFEIENYLAYQGDKLVSRFDATAYLYLLRAIDLFDIGSIAPSLDEALGLIQARVLVVGLSSDVLYPAGQQRELAADLVRLGKCAGYDELATPWGHDGFLIETEAIGGMLASLLAG